MELPGGAGAPPGATTSPREELADGPDNRSAESGARLPTNAANEQAFEVGVTLRHALK